MVPQHIILSETITFPYAVRIVIPSQIILWKTILLEWVLWLSYMRTIEITTGESAGDCP